MSHRIFVAKQELHGRRQVYATAELPADLIAELERTLADMPDYRPDKGGSRSAERSK
jgi:hypothetical protein